jgi:hypothetical protein
MRHFSDFLGRVTEHCIWSNFPNQSGVMIPGHIWTLPGVQEYCFRLARSRLQPYIRPVVESIVPPGPEGIRALPPHHYRDRKGPVSWAGSESAGLTYGAIIRLSPRNLWRDALCPMHIKARSSRPL